MPPLLAEQTDIRSSGWSMVPSLYHWLGGWGQSSAVDAKRSAGVVIWRISGARMVASDLTNNVQAWPVVWGANKMSEIAIKPLVNHGFGCLPRVIPWLTKWKVNQRIYSPICAAR